ncbi:hypothetical protein [uncultured Gammaproteobacteria bacterium]|nr:hypothetical protein [uncultured Gammaproteobacteria bacterium]
MVVLDGCCFIRLVVFWLGYAKVSVKFKFVKCGVFLNGVLALLY